MKNTISSFIDLKLNTEKNQFSDLEKYAIQILKEKLLNKNLNEIEKGLLVNDFISEYLEFDNITGEPINETIEIEKMIDYLIS